MNNVKSIFDFWFLFPLGGIALFQMKKWSLPIFITVQLYSIITHLAYEKYTWPYLSEKPLVYSIMLLIINILLIAYIMLPDLRRIFFDKRTRWWETSTRYFINIPCKMTLISSGESFACQLINISITGMFIESSINLSEKTPLFVKFEYLDTNYSMNGQLIHIHSINFKRGLGIKFLYKNTDSDSKGKIKALIRKLKQIRPVV